MAFDHRAHLCTAFAEIQARGLQGATESVMDRFRAFANEANMPEKFNVTLTVFWMRLIYSAIERNPQASSAEVLFEKEPWLLDKDVPYKFYSNELLNSDHARHRFVEPDKQTFPGS